MWTTTTGSFLSIVVLLGATDPPQPAKTPPDSTPLAGPSVKTGEAARAEPTLVRRGFDGHVEHLETELERAALALVPLTDEQKKEFDRIVAERSSVFAKAIRENYDVLVELGSIDRQTEPGQFMNALERLGEALGDYHKRGNLIQEMAPYLSAEQLQQAAHLANEYVEARVADARASGEKAAKFGMRMRIRFETLGVMARDSIQSAAGMALEMFDDFSQRLHLSAEQQEKIKAITSPIFVQQLQGQAASAAQRLKVFAQIANLLDEQQRRLFVEYGQELQQESDEKRAPENTDGKPPEG